MRDGRAVVETDGEFRAVGFVVGRERGEGVTHAVVVFAVDDETRLGFLAAGEVDEAETFLPRFLADAGEVFWILAKDGTLMVGVPMAGS